MEVDQENVMRLQWHGYEPNLMSYFRNLRTTQKLFDVTLSAEGKVCTAHKMVLIMASPYFESILTSVNNSGMGNMHMGCLMHPVIMLHGVPFQELENILDFLYTGEVCLPKSEFPSFFAAAQKLQITPLIAGAVNNPTDLNVATE